MKKRAAGLTVSRRHQRVKMKRRYAIPGILLAAVAIYFISIVIVFDLNKAAYVSDEEYYEDTAIPVAIGPMVLPWLEDIS